MSNIILGKSLHSPLANHSEIVLCKVFRKPLSQAIWELPAGGLEEGETIEEGALREFREETGVQIFDESRLTALNSVVVSPNRLPMFPAIFQVHLTNEDFADRIRHDDEIDVKGNIRERSIYPKETYLGLKAE